jgi:hypothetical protein
MAVLPLPVVATAGRETRSRVRLAVAATAQQLALAALAYAHGASGGGKAADADADATAAAAAAAAADELELLRADLADAEAVGAAYAAPLRRLAPAVAVEPGDCLARWRARGRGPGAAAWSARLPIWLHALDLLRAQAQLLAAAERRAAAAPRTRAIAAAQREPLLRQVADALALLDAALLWSAGGGDGGGDGGGWGSGCRGGGGAAAAAVRERRDAAASARDAALASAAAMLAAHARLRRAYYTSAEAAGGDGSIFAAETTLAHTAFVAVALRVSRAAVLAAEELMGLPPTALPHAAALTSATPSWQWVEEAALRGDGASAPAAAGAVAAEAPAPMAAAAPAAPAPAAPLPAAPVPPRPACAWLSAACVPKAPFAAWMGALRLLLAVCLAGGLGIGVELWVLGPYGGEGLGKAVWAPMTVLLIFMGTDTASLPYARLVDRFAGTLVACAWATLLSQVAYNSMAGTVAGLSVFAWLMFFVGFAPNAPYWPTTAASTAPFIALGFLPVPQVFAGNAPFVAARVLETFVGLFSLAVVYLILLPLSSRTLARRAAAAAAAAARRGIDTGLRAHADGLWRAAAGEALPAGEAAGAGAGAADAAAAAAALAELRPLLPLAAAEPAVWITDFSGAVPHFSAFATALQRALTALRALGDLAPRALPAGAAAGARLGAAALRALPRQVLRTAAIEAGEAAVAARASDAVVFTHLAVAMAHEVEAAAAAAEALLAACAASLAPTPHWLQGPAARAAHRAAAAAATAALPAASAAVDAAADAYAAAFTDLGDRFVTRLREGGAGGAAAAAAWASPDALGLTSSVAFLVGELAAACTAAAAAVRRIRRIREGVAARFFG